MNNKPHTITELTDLLSNNNNELNQCGTGQTTTPEPPEQLMDEIIKGESDDAPVLNKAIKVVKITIIRNDSKILVEYQHKLKNGTIEPTILQTPSEKIGDKESVYDGLFRGLCEKLYILIKKLEIPEQEPTLNIEEVYSSSYPGLLTKNYVYRYIGHYNNNSYDKDEFETFDESTEKTIHWKWVEASEPNIQM
jgi:hypothetical protein